MKERIKELAEQAGGTVHKAMHGEAVSFLENDLERFAELVRQDEREACAKLCESKWKQQALRYYASLTYSQSANDCATAIRARTT